MMDTHDGGGSAGKKERTTLLREITYLTRLIQQYDHKNKSVSRLGISAMKNQVPKNKHTSTHQLNPSGASCGITVQTNKLICPNVQSSSQHGVQKMSLPTTHSVFVNPQKLNLFEAKCTTERLQKQKCIAGVDNKSIPHRVYINPNFKKSELPPTNKSVSKFGTGHVTSPTVLGTVNKSIYINRKSEFANKIVVSHIVKNVLPANTGDKNSNVYSIGKAQKSISYVNPGHLNKMVSNKKHCLSSRCLINTSKDSQMNIINKKPAEFTAKVLCFNSERKDILKPKSVDVSETCDGSSISSNINPVELKNKIIMSTEETPLQKCEVPNANRATSEQCTPFHLFQESSKNSELVLGKEGTSIACKPKLNVSSSKKSSGLCATVQSQKFRDVGYHRRHSSSSTCLVAVSKTKLVRKRKVDVKRADTESSKSAPGQKKKLMKILPANRYKLNKIATKKIKSATPKTNSVNNNPFRLIKCKPDVKPVPVKTNPLNKDKFKLVRRKSNINGIGSNKFKLLLAQKNVNQVHCPNENVTLLQSKLPSKGKGKNVTIKSKYFIIKNASGIQDKKQIQLVKGATNKWFNPANSMLLTKKTKLVKVSKPKIETNNKTRRIPPGSALMAVSSTKLIRKPISEIKRLQKLKTAEYRPRTKLSPSMRMAYRVKNKYKFIRSQLNVNSSVIGYAHPKQSQVLQETTSIQSTLRKRIASRILKKRCSLVKIGGAYYRASYNKLTRRTPLRAAGNTGSVFKIQGKKYKLERGGQTLKYFRVTPLQLSKLKRSNGNVHHKIGSPNTSWNRLVQAKQRSIALLTNRLRKNNQPCLMFNRFGRCAGKDKGTCNKLHNPKNITICKRFVQGCCENPKCLLSHNVGPEKMPTCHHFLAGNCVRENCPYLHVKLSKKAPICLAFLQGYCADAANCRKRHEHICPKFEEKGVCPKGKYCPYPHPKVKNKLCRSSEQRVTTVETHVNNITEEVEEETKNMVSSCRYFEEATADKFPSVEFKEENVLEETIVNISDEESSNCWINKRPKIGDLPGYIPLMNNSVDKST